MNKWFKLTRTLKIELIVFGVLLVATVGLTVIKFRDEKTVDPYLSPTPSLTASLSPTFSPSASPFIPSPPSTLTSTPEITTGNTYGPIQIIGDETCYTQTSDALSLLQSAATYYNFVTQYIGAIECVEQGSGMFLWYEPPTFKAGRDTREGGTMWYAGTIAHDSCHSKQYQDSRKLSDEKAEAHGNRYKFQQKHIRQN